MMEIKKYPRPQLGWRELNIYLASILDQIIANFSSYFYELGNVILILSY